ncbi:hypothetical protein GcM3_145016 [Golovinomyces cichoracearum]|uniref:Uncharacterized protein n=1 Tax=Golovinomyces cichoracearum TaxID=62708 RepID=A0A420HZ86_9PEZI|nr:hypothetical protein GcM3_145016 [Golovinomyces cichoracearum]
MQIIDNWTRRAWSIPMKAKDQAISQLRKSRVREERQTGRKLISTRSNNAPELKHVMLQWEREDGVIANFKAIASSHQNGPAAPDLGRVERVNAVSIDEKLKGGMIDLKLRENFVISQGTFNQLPLRKNRGRPNRDNDKPKTKVYEDMMVDILPAPAPTPILATTLAPAPTSDPAPTLAPTPVSDPSPKLAAASSTVSTLESTMTLDKAPKKEKRKEKDSQKKKDKKNGSIKKKEREKNPMMRKEKKFSVPSTETIVEKENHDDQSYIDSNRNKTIDASQNPRYFFRKRRKSTANDYEEDKQIKRIRKALLANIFYGIREYESIDKATESSFLARKTFSATPNDRKLKAPILQVFYTIFTNKSDVDEEYALPTKVVNGIQIPRTYKEAINDKVHRPSWNKATLDEIDALVSNETQEEHILLDGANTV